MIELRNYSRSEVNLLLNAVDLLLLTSFSEGSPMIIKEAMACNCPIVSVNVGDVERIIGGTKNCCIVDYNPNTIAEKIRLILNSEEKTNGREKIRFLEVDKMSEPIYQLYEKIIYGEKRNGYNN